MLGNDAILDYLQQAIRAELSAINQYTLHSAIFANLGMPRLAKRWKDEAAEEMGHRDRYIARMVFLEGKPDVGTLNPLTIGSTIEEILRADLAAEMAGRKLYLDASRAAFDAGDLITHELFESILEDEEGHIDFLETQLRLIAALGPQIYASRYLDEFED